MKHAAIALAAALMVSAWTWTASATVSDYLPVGGMLTDLDGVPLDGQYDIVFALYDEQAAATPIWSESYEALEIEDGLFTVYLGAITPLDFHALIQAPELWLGMTVGTDSEMGRIPLGSVPFAIEAYQCQFLGNLQEGDVQPMLSGANECPAGTFLRGWDEVAMAPICEVDSTGFTVPERASPPSANTTTTLVSEGDTGFNPRITIGADGLGVISYFSTTSGGVEVAHCDDLACTSATVNTIAAAGTRSDIAIGVDGLPIVTFENAGAVAVVHCEDVACAATTLTEIETATASFPAIVIGSDGLPLIGYRWTGGASGGLRTAHCQNVACTSFVTNDAVANDYVNNNLTAGLAPDGVAVFAYQRWQSGDEDMMLARCHDVACTTATAITLTDMNDPRTPVMTIGADGLPLLVFQYYWGGQVIFLHCNDKMCSSDVETTPPLGWGNTQTSQGTYSLTVGTNGLPFATLSGVNADPGRLLGLHCSNSACTTVGPTVIETSGAGGETSVTIGVDGNPLIAYRNSTTQDLMVTHCSNPICAPYFRRR